MAFCAKMEILNFIGGEWTKATSGKCLENRNPATNEIYSTFPDSDENDVQRAVNAAKAAFPEWSKTSITERANYLRKIADEIELNHERLAKLEVKDTGKSFGFAFNVDMDRAAKNFRFFAKQIEMDVTECFQGVAGLNYAQRSPLGVCALITPWNLPLYLLSWKVAPALACGNTVVCKPSELTPRTAYELGKICEAVGLPKGVVNIVQGTGKSAGQPLVEHPDVSCVSFTGGTITGSKVAALGASQFKKMSLELGGKNPGIIFADCDLKKTVNDLMRACFANQGQVCLCMERLFVEKSIMDELLRLILKKVEEHFTIGDPLKSNFGSLISQQHRMKVESYFKLAQEEGGTIACGGKRPNLQAPFDKGAFVEPTIITGLSHTSRCATEEVFGPFVK